MKEDLDNDFVFGQDQEDNGAQRRHGGRENSQKSVHEGVFQHGDQDPHRRVQRRSAQIVCCVQNIGINVIQQRVAAFHGQVHLTGHTDQVHDEGRSQQDDLRGGEQYILANSKQRVLEGHQIADAEQNAGNGGGQQAHEVHQLGKENLLLVDPVCQNRSEGGSCKTRDQRQHHAVAQGLEIGPEALGKYLGRMGKGKGIIVAPGLGKRADQNEHENQAEKEYLQAGQPNKKDAEGLGTVFIEDIPAGGTVVGVPALSGDIVLQQESQKTGDQQDNPRDAGGFHVVYADNLDVEIRRQCAKISADDHRGGKVRHGPQKDQQRCHRDFR